MDLIIIAGFLGSGKTTLLLHVVKSLTKRSNKKVAIIENEVGETGVDDQYLQEYDLNVREIYSGCICCSLRISLVQTLLELERDYHPDIVILEPSGVASAKQTLSAVDGYGGDIERKIVITLFDAVRFFKITNFSMPIIADGIAAADVLVINKADLVDEEKLSSIKQNLLEVASKKPIIPVSALTGANIDSLMSFVQENTSDRENVSVAPEPDCAAKKMNPVVYSEQLDLRFQVPVTSQYVIENLTKFISDIAKNIGAAESSLIGHIKAIVKAGKQGYLLISSTAADSEPQIKGKLANDISKMTLTFNIIVYGIEQEDLDNIVAIQLEHNDLFPHNS